MMDDNISNKINEKLNNLINKNKISNFNAIIMHPKLLIELKIEVNNKLLSMMNKRIDEVKSILGFPIISSPDVNGFKFIKIYD